VLLISGSIEIAATPAQVWDVLLDFAAYPEWNPFVSSISGGTTPGSKLRVTVQPQGGRPMSFEPTVLVCNPGRELRWLGSVLARGVFDGEHSFALSELTPNSCKFVHEERFSGLLVPLLMRGTMRTGTQAGFEAMNRALKQRAERGAA
jgi:hypothetical protein